VNKREILVLGSGVSGLSCGILLLKAGYKVTIWAKEFPPHTTSDSAAAFWYPYLCNPRDKASVWAGNTLRYLRQFVLPDLGSGCVIRTVTEVFDHPSGDPWWALAVPEWHRPQPSQLPAGYTDGYQTDAALMDTTRYMDWLQKQYAALGGTRRQHQVRNMDEATAACDVVVNCTGLGARELCHDERLYPIRGQVVKIKSNGFNQIIADDEGPNSLAVIIPRLDDIVLGGTTQANDWNLEVDPADTKEILRKAALLSPAFKHVEITSESVGLRPARDEVRLEVELAGPGAIVHNYGHGGSGFTLSWGCAQDVLEHIRQL
jgi:D-amino-acid oxidase